MALVLSALVGGSMTLLGAWLATSRAESSARKERAFQYKLRIWMELQDAYEGLANLLGRQLRTLGGQADLSHSDYFADPLLRVQILARFTDYHLIQLEKRAMESAASALDSATV